MSSILRIKTAPTVEPVSLAEAIRQVRLDVTSPELSSGTLVIGRYYLITATTTNYFGTGLAVGDTFLAAAATALSSTCKVREVTEGALLTSYIKAARMHVEGLCGPLITQTWYQYDSEWPSNGVLEIGKPRLQTVTAIKYTDADGTEATFAASNYTVAVEDEQKPAIVLKDTAEWPSVELFNIHPIETEFVCGYGATAATVPEPIRLAMLFLVAHWHEIREPVIVGHTVVSVPMTFDNLIFNERRWGF